MKQVFILAENLQHIKNWARHYNINLANSPNIKWAKNEKDVRGYDRGGYFIVITWPARSENLVNLLEYREYTNLPVDIDEWPLDAFTQQSY